MTFYQFTAALVAFGCAAAAAFFFVRAMVLGVRSIGGRRDILGDPLGWNPFNYTEEGWRAVAKAYANMVCAAVLAALGLVIAWSLGWVHGVGH